MSVKEKIKSIISEKQIVQVENRAPERDPSDAVEKANELLASAGVREKTFDWYHYQLVNSSGMQAAYQNEFNNIPTIRVLKSLYIQEPWVASCMNAIARQFMGVDLVLKFKVDQEGNEQLVKKHPFLDFLNTAGSENRAFFTTNNILDLTLTGNNYWFITKDLQFKQRLAAERVEPYVKDNQVQYYRLMNDGGDAFQSKNVTLQPDEVVHLKMPNPFSVHVGLAMLISLSLPVLIDKYGREYIIGFFLRGGNTSGIIETDTTNGDQLLSLAKTIMQAFGGRRNMHADKILPKGAKWAGQGNSFREIQLMELLKENVGLFKSLTGCTNTVLGLSEGVNYATAKTEMELFWKMTVLPLQQIYCSGIMSSSLWSRFNLPKDAILAFDNTNVEWLDTFQYKLEQDKLLTSWSVNERRERLGKPIIERLGDKLELELKAEAKNPGDFGLSPTAPDAAPPADDSSKNLGDAKAIDGTIANDPMAHWKSIEAEIQNPTKRTDTVFTREFAAWESIILSNLQDKKAAKKAIKARRKEFARKFADVMLPEAMRAYDNQLNGIIHPGKKSVRQKDSDQDRQARLDSLRQRAMKYVGDKIAEGEEEAFIGFSNTQAESVYALIHAELADGKSLSDVAYAVRQRFDEFYEGQAKTIVNTEYGSAIALGQAQVAKDLAQVSKKMSKEWVTMEDKFVREDHQALDGQVVEGLANELEDEYFTLGDEDYLRYPKESTDDAGKVVNCRCTVRYRVLEWTDESSNSDSGGEE